MPDLTITGVFDAPRNLVFKAWTGSAQANEWSECFDRLEEQRAGVDSANPGSTYR